MNDAESPAKYSLYGHWARVYREERIKEHYHMSFDEFLLRPRYRIEIMLAEVKEINDKDAEESAKLRAEWENTVKNAKGQPTQQ